MEKQQYRSYIITRASLEETPTQIHNDLVAVYGSQAPSYSTVLRWSHRSEEKKMDIEDMPRSGRPVSQTTTENIEWVRSLIEADPHSTYEDIEAETLLSRGTIERIIQERLHLKQVTSRYKHIFLLISRIKKE